MKKNYTTPQMWENQFTYKTDISMIADSEVTTGDNLTKSHDDDVEGSSANDKVWSEGLW